MALELTPDTDLTALVGVRVRAGALGTVRINQVRHGAGARQPVLRGGVWGDLWQEASGGVRGGSSAFWWPYGTLLTPPDRGAVIVVPEQSAGDT